MVAPNNQFQFSWLQPLMPGTPGTNSSSAPIDDLRAGMPTPPPRTGNSFGTPPGLGGDLPPGLVLKLMRRPWLQSMGNGYLGRYSGFGDLEQSVAQKMMT